jgi:hypothetical protein
MYMLGRRWSLERGFGWPVGLMLKLQNVVGDVLIEMWRKIMQKGAQTQGEMVIGVLDLEVKGLHRDSTRSQNGVEWSRVEDTIVGLEVD